MLCYARFYALPHSLALALAECRHAAKMHARELHADREPLAHHSTAWRAIACGRTLCYAMVGEPFLRKEDDPLNGFWVYKCLREANGCDTHSA